MMKERLPSPSEESAQKERISLADQSRERLFTSNDLLGQIVLLRQPPNRRLVQRFVSLALITEEESKHLLHYQTKRNEKRQLLDERIERVWKSMKDVSQKALDAGDPVAIPMLLAAGMFHDDETENRLDSIYSTSGDKKKWQSLLVKAKRIESKGGNVVFPSRNTLSGIPILTSFTKGVESQIIPHSMHVGDTNRKFREDISPMELAMLTMSNPHIYS